MIYLKSQIKDQKVLELEVDFDKYILENGITDKSMIHTLVFDKSVFQKEVEVREYVKSVMYMYAYELEIIESDSSFTVMPISKSSIDTSTEISIELRRGVVAHAADLMPVTHLEEFAFNKKGEVNLSSKLGTIEFNASMPSVIEIAKVATGFHPKYGNISVTQQDLESMVKNFEAKVTVIDLAVNEDHSKKEAFGWYKDVWLSYDKQTLYGQIEWNTKGTTALSDKEYRYFSPEFRFNYVQPMTGVEYGPTLLGGALTNYPFLEMDAIVELSNKINKTKGAVTMTTETIDLSVHNKTIVDLNGKMNTLQVDLNTKTQENEILAAKVKELENTISLNAKHSAFDKLFSAGHVNKAQLDALKEGKDMVEILSLNAKTNMSNEGDNTAPLDTIELNDGQKKVAESLGLTLDEYKATQI